VANTPALVGARSQAMISNVKIYEACDVETFSRLDLAVHGAKFSVENIHHDTEAGIATLTFEYPRIGEAVVETSRPPRWKIRAPVRSWLLTFFGIATARVEDVAQVGWYEIGSLEWRLGSVVIEAVPFLVVSLECSTPRVVVEVSEEIVDWKTFTRLGLRRPSPTSEDPLR